MANSTVVSKQAENGTLRHCQIEIFESPEIIESFAEALCKNSVICGFVYTVYVIVVHRTGVL